MVSNQVSLRDVLAGYDRRVQDDFRQAVASTTGTGRVQSLHTLRRSVSVHDSVLESALCPLLEDLPRGPEVADRLRRGCHERADLLAGFQAVSDGVAAGNVYPVVGEEIERILTELEHSFNRHVEDETTKVGDILEAAAQSLTPEVVSARMAIEARRSPSRVHSLTERHPSWTGLRLLYHYADKLHDWNDTHHGWPAAKRRMSPPVQRPIRMGRRPPSIPDLLAGYDETVQAFIDDLSENGRSGPDRAEAAYRLAAAIAIHDSILDGVLCRLLDSVSEGEALAGRLREGCRERAELLQAWNALTKGVSADDLYRTQASEADAIITPLIESFRSHENLETAEVAAVVERLREKSWPWRGSSGSQTIWVWPNPEPGVLGAHMALWADRAPTRIHPFMAKHPTNRVLRNLYSYTDQVRDWRDSRHGWPTLT